MKTIKFAKPMFTQIETILEKIENEIMWNNEQIRYITDDLEENDYSDISYIEYKKKEREEYMAQCSTAEAIYNLVYSNIPKIMKEIDERYNG